MAAKNPPTGYNKAAGRMTMQKCWTAALGAVVLGFAAVPTAAQAQSWQCATFARAFSGLQLFGRAASWWHQAVGKYSEGGAPRPGAVLVFKAGRGMGAGHVATVTEIVSSRIIEVTHANWSPIDGRRGQIERDVTVVDASPDNDWSRVRVWYAPRQDLGTGAYRTYGFIYGPKPSASDAPRAPVLVMPKHSTPLAAPETASVDLGGRKG